MRSSAVSCRQRLLAEAGLTPHEAQHGTKGGRDVLSEYGRKRSSGEFRSGASPPAARCGVAPVC